MQRTNTQAYFSASAVTINNVYDLDTPGHDQADERAPVQDPGSGAQQGPML